jgi:signal transduction histidine kinase
MGDLSERPTCYGITHRRATPCDGTEHTCPLQEVKKTGKPVSVEHIHYDKEGNARNVEVSAYPILDEEGNVVRMIEYMLDITERRRLEKELEGYAERVKLFAYSVSHDLKNPIMAIHGLTRLLCKREGETLNDTTRAYCNRILKTSQQALTLIEEINAFIRAKKAVLNLEPFPPKEVFAQVKTEFRDSMAGRGIRWSEPANVPEIKADKTSMIRVFRNLVDNALKYGGKDMREIKVEYKEEEGLHLFSIYNDGAGIDRQNSEKIFETFQRSDKSGGVESTGLGLSIVREIAEKHGGRAWVESEGGKGVTFYVSISSRLG